ncbi:MAG: hypothetical protein FWE12_00455 [Oscillospiraceae bacterium]|nr:hypothetical protein [Oscillospiraceae bacterium]
MKKLLIWLFVIVLLIVGLIGQLPEVEQSAIPQENVDAALHNAIYMFYHEGDEESETLVQALEIVIKGIEVRGNTLVLTINHFFGPFGEMTREDQKTLWAVLYMAGQELDLNYLELRQLELVVAYSSPGNPAVMKIA